MKGERIWRTSTCLTRSCFKMPRKRVKWLDDEKHVRQQHALALSPSSFAEEEYAGTPPLAACRSAVSFAACMHNSGAGSNGLIGLYDTSVAFFHAVNDEGIYAEPPLGEEPEDIVYQAHEEPCYGTRRASFLFQNLVMEKSGFLRLQITVQLFFHIRRTGHRPWQRFPSVGSVGVSWCDELIEQYFKAERRPRVGNPRHGACAHAQTHLEEDDLLYSCPFLHSTLT